MFLSDSDIKRALKKGDIVITPFVNKQLQPASYDIRLGSKFILTESHASEVINPAKNKFAKIREVLLKKGEVFVLHPGVSILGISIERFGSKTHLIQLHGKSSLARIGLLVHNTAGLVNPGHFLQISFELCNLNKVPIVLTPGMEIGQLTFSQMSSGPEIDYKSIDSKYIDKNWRVPSRPKIIKRKKK